MKRLLLSILACFMLVGNAWAQDASEESGTGLKVPRMVSLRSNLVNARSGPGSRYPIEWVYKQKNAPMEIVAEFELWRKIKDWDGAESWVHKSMLSGKRTAKIIAKGENNIYKKPDYKTQIVAKIEDGVVGEVEKCPATSEFCLIKFSAISGWITRNSLFGIYPNEVID